MTTKVSANGVSVAHTTTKANSIGIVRHTDLGFLALDEDIYNSPNGLISLNPGEVWSNKINLWSGAADTSFTGNVAFSNQIILTGPQNSENSLARIQQYIDIPKTLLRTTVGSFDLQFSTQNKYTANVTSVGTPSYITSFSNPQYSSPFLCGYDEPTTAGISQNTAPFIVGNADSLGGNYTIINAQFGELITNAATSGQGGLSGSTANPGLISTPFPLSGNCANFVKGRINMVLDAAVAAELENNQYNGSFINPKWKGNYKYTAFSAIFKIREVNFWNHYGYGQTLGNDEFHYEIDMIPVTEDAESADYGKFNVSIIAASTASYNSLNLGFRWLITVNKFRNFVV
jgi:hypothetical protein